MLKELSIRNLAVVERVHLLFHQGFHVLTGETGAGKSIIIDALGLLAGGRGSSELVRYGQEKAEMEALFEVEDDHPVWRTLAKIGMEPGEDEHLIIRREINSQGKSVSRINGQLVNLATLKETGEWLINIHGQHEHQSLLKAEGHIQWLDLFGGQEIAALKERYQTAFEAYSERNREVQEWKDRGMQTLQMQDLYRFQVEELSSAKLKAGEDESLGEERRKLGNAEKLYQNVNESYEALYGNGRGMDLVRKSLARLQDVATYDPGTLQPIVEQIQSAFYQLEDAAYQLRDYRDGISFDPDRLNQIELRLDLLSSLRRKYGESVSDMLAYLENIRKELSNLDHNEEKLQELEQERQAQWLLSLQLAKELSALRKAAAGRLAEAIEKELKELHMERTKFHVELKPAIDDGSSSDAGELPGAVRLTRYGMDTVEFLIAPNPGEPLRGLGKIASGGELSRIMLAMKSIFAKVDQIPVLVFDEVDTGVSGRAAQAIAEKMAKLSADCQVFSITHLPQVACMADAHYLIRKVVEGDRTFTQVEDLSLQGRTEELARMLGGVEITEKTLQHAKEMLDLADARKSGAMRE